MSRNLGTAALFFCLYLAALPLLAQQPKAAPPPAAPTAMSAEQALTLAAQGHCKEALPALKHALTAQGSPVDTRKQAGVAGLRCSLAADNRDLAVDFIRLLTKEFSRDPDILFIIVHAYSDLSSRTAQTFSIPLIPELKTKYLPSGVQLPQHLNGDLFHPASNG